MKKTKKRGSRSLKTLERRKKGEEKTTENLFKTSLSRKILGLVNVLRHILGPEKDTKILKKMERNKITKDHLKNRY